MTELARVGDFCPNKTPFQQPSDTQGAGLLQGSRDASGRSRLGRHRLQPDPPAEDLAS